MSDPPASRFDNMVKHRIYGPLCFSKTRTPMNTPAAAETLVLDWLASQEDGMLALVRTLVDIDSGSYDKAGVDAVGARLRAFLAAHDIAFSVIANDRFGDAIRAQVNNAADSPTGYTNAPVLLL